MDTENDAQKPPQPPFTHFLCKRASRVRERQQREQTVHSSICMTGEKHHGIPRPILLLPQKPEDAAEGGPQTQIKAGLCVCARVFGSCELDGRGCGREHVQMCSRCPPPPPSMLNYICVSQLSGQNAQKNIQLISPCSPFFPHWGLCVRLRNGVCLFYL